MSKIVPIRPDCQTFKEFLADLEERAKELQATRAYLVLFNDRGERMPVEFMLTAGDLALVLVDMMGLAVQTYLSEEAEANG